MCGSPPTRVQEGEGGEGGTGGAGEGRRLDQSALEGANTKKTRPPPPRRPGPPQRAALARLECACRRGWGGREGGGRGGGPAAPVECGRGSGGGCGHEAGGSGDTPAPRVWVQRGRVASPGGGRTEGGRERTRGRGAPENKVVGRECKEKKRTTRRHPLSVLFPTPQPFVRAVGRRVRVQQTRECKKNHSGRKNQTNTGITPPPRSTPRPPPPRPPPPPSSRHAPCRTPSAPTQTRGACAPG